MSDRAAAAAMRSGGSCTVVLALAVLATLLARGPRLELPVAAARPDLARRSAEPPALGLRFEANVGQSDARVRFVARYGRATALLTNDALIVLPPAARAHRSAAERHAFVHGGGDANIADTARAPSTIRLRDANPLSAMVGEAPIAASITSFAGASGVGRSIPSFARVRAREVYPGIDVVFHAGERGIELDFEVAPGADPSVIALAGDADAAPALRSDGTMVFGHGLALSAPRTYEVGAQGESFVASAWSGPSDARFSLGPRSPGLPLVIDPVIDLATYIGGSGVDLTGMGGIALDAAGSVYVAGTTTSPDLPVTPGAPFAMKLGTDDVFVAKLSADFKTLAYCTYLGGSDTETYSYVEQPIAVDAAGALYVTGETASTDFPTTANAYDRTANGGYDMFVTKLAPSGTSLVYSTYLGSSGDDHGFGLAVDGGSAFVAGYMKGSDFPLTAGSIPTVSTGTVTKLAPDGGSLVYSTRVGGATTAIFGLAVRNGAAYAIGDTQAGSFPATAGAYQTVYGGGSYDALVIKLKSDGTGYQYATYLGGDGLDEAFAIDVDSAGNAVVVGGTLSTDFPRTANAFVATAGGSYDGYVAKLDATGAKLLYGSYISAPGYDLSTGVCFDPLGNAFIVGTTYGGIRTKGSCTTSGGGFVQMLEPSGNVRFTSLLSDQAYGIACGASRVVGFMAVAGDTPFAAPGVFDPSFNGGTDQLVFDLQPGPNGAPGCLPCDGAFGATTLRACPDAATPLCNASGALIGSCTICTATDLTRCTPAQICSKVTGECVAAPPPPTDAGPDGSTVDADADDDAAAATDASSDAPSDAPLPPGAGLASDACSCRGAGERDPRNDASSLALGISAAALALLRRYRSLRVTMPG